MSRPVTTNNLYSAGNGKESGPETDKRKPPYVYMHISPHQNSDTKCSVSAKCREQKSEPSDCSTLLSASQSVTLGDVTFLAPLVMILLDSRVRPCPEVTTVRCLLQLPPVGTAWRSAHTDKGKSPIIERFPNTGRFSISYQEVLRSLLKNVNHQADEVLVCNHSLNGQLLRTSVLTRRVCFGALWNSFLSLNCDSRAVEGKLFFWISLVISSVLSVILNNCFRLLVEF